MVDESYRAKDTVHDFLADALADRRPAQLRFKEPTSHEDMQIVIKGVEEVPDDWCRGLFAKERNNSRRVEIDDQRSPRSCIRLSSAVSSNVPGCGRTSQNRAPGTRGW